MSLLGREGGAVLADATGLGKTYVAIAVAREFGPALVVAPAALRGMWHEALRRTGVAAAVDSYEALSRAGRTERKPPALLVLDEAHHVRNPSARRYAAVAGLAWGARVLMLTATPIHNRGRDLRALLALFTGSRAHHMNDDEVRRLMVRRSDGAWDRAAKVPLLARPEWLDVPHVPDVLEAIRALPPAVPASDGAPAHALMLLGLIRAWCSSEAALRATLRRRLRQAAALEAALDAGALPGRRELASWPVVDDAVQLGLPGLALSSADGFDTSEVRAALSAHAEGVRSALRLLDDSSAGDDCRVRHLTSIRAGHAGVPIVAFTQFADTGSALFRRCSSSGGVALVSGAGARVVSGTVSVDDIVRGFDIADVPRVTPRAMPLDVLITTDVLSEGLSLRRAGVLVHLDLPWTVARLEQRIGRLRRPGSLHQRVAVYAIGPPAGARALSHAIRALQRKARLAAALGGDDDLAGAVPLSGSRFARFSRASAAPDGFRATESLRHLATSWLNPGALDQHARAEARIDGVHAIALVRHGATSRLLAVSDSGVSEKPEEVLAVARCISSAPPPNEDQLPLGIEEQIDRWLADQRGRAIAAVAVDMPSSAHAAVLHALHELLDRAPRSERVRLAARVERCRALVNAARGIGAEWALSRFREGNRPLELEALEGLLASHHVPGSADRGLALEAVVVVSRGARAFVDESAYLLGSRFDDLPHPVEDADRDARVNVAAIGGSRRPGPQQSSTPHPVPDAARG